MVNSFTGGILMKIKKLKGFLLIMIAVSLLTSGEAYSAWTQAKGHSYHQVTASYYESKNLYSTVQHEGNDVVERVPSAKFTSTDLSYYGEYGIIDPLTVFASFAWKTPRSNDTLVYAQENGPSGIGDIDLGLRYNLTQNLFGTGTLCSLQGTVKIPEAYEYGYPFSYLSNGDGQYNTTLDIMFGKGIGKGYILFNVGYKYRFENDNNIDIYPPGVDSSADYSFKPSDQVKVFIGGGYALPHNLELRGSVEYTKAVGNASASQELLVAAAPYGINSDEEYKLFKDTLGLEQDVLNLGVGMAYTFPKAMLNGTWQTVFTYNQDVSGVDIFRTKNAGQGKTFSLALVYMH